MTVTEQMISRNDAFLAEGILALVSILYLFAFVLSPDLVLNPFTWLVLGVLTIGFFFFKWCEPKPDGDAK